jgi:dolichyl-diphosphooligosaccharide--protein glycosyltransferase
MDRTQLGFVDHHALEACLAIATLFALVRAIRATESAVLVATVIAGVMLGLYLLAWASGALLLAIIGAWALTMIPLARSPGDLARLARVIGIAALLALAVVTGFQDPRMHRYGSQVIGLAGLAAIALALHTLPLRGAAMARTLAIGAGLAVVIVIAGMSIWWLSPELVRQVLLDLGRLAPDPTRMSVLEARPLFMYPGSWNWSQPWEFFRTGFYAGAIALALFTVRVWRDRESADVLMWVFVAAMFIATIGQNRFGYYLVTGCALLAGWLAAAALDWAGVPHSGDPQPVARTRFPLARELTVIAVTAALFAPNIAPSVVLAPRGASMAGFWQDTMTWLAAHTPPAFAESVGRGDDYYLARYSRESVPAPDYTVMNWWDQGYWITQRARRVPVANPTQERAGRAARFYVETDERRAVALLAEERVRFVLSDWELPFRRTPEGTVMGRFQNIADWAGSTHAEYYEIVYTRSNDAWTPIWVFHESYYRSMAYRLSVHGGQAAVPANATTVISVGERLDSDGVAFRELLAQNTYASFDAALQAATTAAPSATRTMIVGLDPWQTAFPIERLTALTQVHAARTPEQAPAETPWARVFEVRSAIPERD